MALWWIDVARDNLIKASNKYADVQKQIDRYNKVFETYANASPETQMRAASVMRQAIDEYNWLKKQQEENTLKIYEAQNWINYFNKQEPITVQATQLHSIAPNQIEYPIEDMTMARPTQSVQVIPTQTPGILNNSAPVTSAELNALDTNQTMIVSNPVFNNLNAQNRVSPTTPISVSRIIQQPQYSNTTLSPVDKVTSTAIKPINYGPWSVATIWTWGMAWITTNNSLLNTTNRRRIIPTGLSSKNNALKLWK